MYYSNSKYFFFHQQNLCVPFPPLEPIHRNVFLFGLVLLLFCLLVVVLSWVFFFVFYVLPCFVLFLFCWGFSCFFLVFFFFFVFSLGFYCRLFCIVVFNFLPLVFLCFHLIGGVLCFISFLWGFGGSFLLFVLCFFFDFFYCLLWVFYFLDVFFLFWAFSF